MPKFKKEKKVVRVQAGAFTGSSPMKFPDQEVQSPERQVAGALGRGITGASRFLIGLMGGDPDLPQRIEQEKLNKQLESTGRRSLDLTKGMTASMPKPTPPASRRGVSGKASPKPDAVGNLYMDEFKSRFPEPSPQPQANVASPTAAPPAQMIFMPKQIDLSDIFGRRKYSESATASTGTPADMAKAAGEIPKTKAGLKKFMQEYGKFIALGAMAGQGGKGGQIAAPIMAALPGLIEIMKSKKKSSGGEPPKKSEGGAIRKFKGGSMKGNSKNSMDSMLTPKYAKGGKTDKMGKAAGEMPQHKKMAMGKPTPQSTGQKFAKGGAAKYAGGGMCKGYGISKKIRPTGPMN